MYRPMTEQRCYLRQRSDRGECVACGHLSARTDCNCARDACDCRDA